MRGMKINGICGATEEIDMNFFSIYGVHNETWTRNLKVTCKNVKKTKQVSDMLWQGEIHCFCQCYSLPSTAVSRASEFEDRLQVMCAVASSGVNAYEAKFMLSCIGKRAAGLLHSTNGYTDVTSNVLICMNRCNSSGCRRCLLNCALFK
jgi:hypothetical protein